MRPIDADAMIANLEAMRDSLGYTAITLDGMIQGLREAPVIDLAMASEVLPPPTEAGASPKPVPDAEPLTEVASNE